ncbi:MAG: peptidylprolyl isomerase [Gemmatimonadota bacterium]|jgi:peptidylprolyl isomerase|nr:peptidylprolyl isomerase [Gemmatimonadota bacterium]MDP6460708.1 peptidylprolyl isomerase [Gemmatimonadota bacterium]MDP6528203.1 peptidylprolyl isomerase [Gemmatimonadota bacterium]MDP6801998.1 peptidylprolyl isomerase [Gemmatimonadota bacterium]MDP7031346.1 peptidylprolyl isomerase [Gemmatimonadota bacterium]
MSAPRLVRTRTLLPGLAVLCAASALPPSDAAAEPTTVEEATAPDGIYAVFETTVGDFVCRLHYDKVPVTVGNFVGLAEGTKEFKDAKTHEMTTRPFYDGLGFHRIIKDFMSQGGCPLGNGRGDPGYRFIDEFDPALRHARPGILSMANSGPGTNGSQFFVTHVPTPWLDDKHSVFGECVMGLDIVLGMGQVPMKGSQNSTPVTDIVANSVRIVRTGESAKAFDAAAAFARQDEIRAAATERKAAMEKQFTDKLGAELGVNLDERQTTPTGLEFVVLEEGEGASPESGQTISAHYTGYLLDGTKFDSSVDRGQPFDTQIGVRRVIPGWDEAFLEMKPGEKRVLFIPPDLGYGPRGAGGVIPPNATLIFVVELLAVQ